MILAPTTERTALPRFSYRPFFNVVGSNTGTCGSSETWYCTLKSIAMLFSVSG